MAEGQQIVNPISQTAVTYRPQKEVVLPKLYCKTNYGYFQSQDQTPLGREQTCPEQKLMTFSVSPSFKDGDLNYRGRFNEELIKLSDTLRLLEKEPIKELEKFKFRISGESSDVSTMSANAMHSYIHQLLRINGIEVAKGNISFINLELKQTLARLINKGLFK